MPIKKRQPAQKSTAKVGKTIRSKTRRSMMLGLVVVALLVMGVGSALAVFQYSQDNRSSAAGKACYDPKGFWYDCTPKETEYEKYIRQIQDKLKADREAKERAAKIKAAVEADKKRNEEKRKAEEAAKKATNEKKTPVVTAKPAEKTKAQIDAENVEKARAQQQENRNSGGNNTTPTPIPQLTPIGEYLPVVEQKKTSSNRKKTRWITALSQSDKTLSGSVVVGKLYKSPGTGRKAVHECYFHDWDEYIIMTSDSTTRPSHFCSNTTANWKETYKGIIGYAAANKSSAASLAIQECWDETNLNHAYTTKEGDCSPYTNSISPKPKVTKSWNYGWMVN